MCMRIHAHIEGKVHAYLHTSFYMRMHMDMVFCVRGYDTCSHLSTTVKNKYCNCAFACVRMYVCTCVCMHVCHQNICLPSGVRGPTSITLNSFATSPCHLCACIRPPGLGLSPTRWSTSDDKSGTTNSWFCCPPALFFPDCCSAAPRELSRASLNIWMGAVMTSDSFCVLWMFMCDKSSALTCRSPFA
jgi:hypothetical protein